MASVLDGLWHHIKFNNTISQVDDGDSQIILSQNGRKRNAWRIYGL